MPNAPQIIVPPRNELSAIQGVNERIVRYLEFLSQGVNDARMLTGTGSPEGVVSANSSRLYMDLENGNLYKNTNPEYGINTGWVLV